MSLKRGFLMTILVLALCTFGTAQQVLAKDSTMTIDDASPQEVVDGMANKLARGVANVATGWLELPKQIYLTCKEDGYAKGLTVGPIKGIGMTLVRTAAGLGDTGKETVESHSHPLQRTDQVPYPPPVAHHEIGLFRDFHDRSRHVRHAADQLERHLLGYGFRLLPLQGEAGGGAKHEQQQEQQGHFGTHFHSS
jgi:putative exosortase-associated protein (TIGR04073 family)